MKKSEPKNGNTPSRTNTRENRDGDAPPKSKTGSGTATEPVNPFDPAKLRLTQDFGAELGVKKQLVAVSVKRPNKQEWVRTHPDEEYHLQTAVLELKEERETYLVDPALWPVLAGEVTPKVLFTAINRQGVVFLWQVLLPGEDGRIDPPTTTKSTGGSGNGPTLSWTTP